ncbi:MAG: hypothetical protein ACM3SS_18945 [Rhodospirillaceae bacterium]
MSFLRHCFMAAIVAAAVAAPAYARASGMVCVYNASGAGEKSASIIAQRIRDASRKYGYDPRHNGTADQIARLVQEIGAVTKAAFEDIKTEFDLITAYVARASIRAQGQNTTWAHLAVMQSVCKTYAEGTMVQYWTQHWWSGYKSACHNWVKITDGMVVNVIMTGHSGTASCTVATTDGND